jgi:hypothetical protein
VKFWELNCVEEEEKNQDAGASERFCPDQTHHLQILARAFTNELLYFALTLLASGGFPLLSR